MGRNNTSSEQLSSHRYYDVHHHEWISPLEKVHLGLQADDRLQETYDVMQTITHALLTGDQERLATCLQAPHHDGPQMQGVLRSFRNYDHLIKRIMLMQAAKIQKYAA